jgi:hypothetical protein
VRGLASQCPTELCISVACGTVFNGTVVLLPKGPIYPGTPKHNSVGKVLRKHSRTREETGKGRGPFIPGYSRGACWPIFCKRELKHLSDGTQLKLEAPYGSFTLHATTAIPAVFLIGGGGSTPVGSMVLEATNKAPPRRQPSRAGRKWYPSQPDSHSYVMSSAIAGHPAARARCRDQSIEG